MDTILFTPSSLIDLLSKIDELADIPVSLTETIDGDIQLEVGDSVYLIQSEEAEEVSVDESVVDKIEDTNLEAYENLDSDVDVTLQDDESESVESGILKEVAKSLLLGGMIRLSAKMLK